MKVNLNELFKVQRRLDAEIEVNHPSVEGEDRLAKRILALQVELGECANEWRGFKFWSNRQTANTLYQTTCDPDLATHHYCEDCKEDVANKDTLKHFKKCEGVLYPMKSKNPLLEEYVDCLHFILSIGLEDAGSCVWDWEYNPLVSWDKNITRQFIDLNASISAFAKGGSLEMTIRLFIGLGELLGFTWEQIESAYMSKNETNWKRQENGY